MVKTDFRIHRLKAFIQLWKLYGLRFTSSSLLLTSAAVEAFSSRKMRVWFSYIKNLGE